MIINCVCRVAREREIHRKISSGGALVAPAESGSLPEPQLSTVADGQEGKEEGGKEEKPGESPTTEQGDHITKAADGEKAENPAPEAAGDESKETKESGASDTTSTPTVGKTDVEVNEAAKVGQSEVQREPEGAKGSDHTAEDIHPQQDTTPEPQAAAPKEDTASPTELLEVSKDPVAVSTEPVVDSATAGASLEMGKPPSEPSSSSTAVPAETEQPRDGGGEGTEEQGSDQPSLSAEPATVSPSGDSQTDSERPLLGRSGDSQLPLLSSSADNQQLIVSPSGDSQTESLSYVANSLTEQLLSST